MLDPTRVRELELSLVQLCKSHFANQSFQNELVAAYRANQGLAVFTAHHLGQTKARELSAYTAQLCTLAAGKLQVARDLCSPASIHYVPLPQTMQPYLPLDDHDVYMDLCNVVQNNLAGRGPDPTGAEVLRYENVFPNIATDSVDLVMKAETSYHPKRPANHGVKGEVGSIHLRGGRSTTYLFKFAATVIMAVWATLPFSLWSGMGMNAYFAYTIVGFKDQSNPVKKVTIAVTIEDVIFIVTSLLAIRRMIFKILPAWMMKAPMAGIGMFLAIGLHSGTGIDIIRDHPAVLVDLSKVQYQLRSDNQREKELAEHYNLQKWLRELEHACEYKGKNSTLQLRACQKVRHHLALQKWDRTKTNLDNELATNLANLILKKKLVPLLLDRHFALAASFQLFGNKAWKKLRVASNEISFYNKRKTKNLLNSFEENSLTTKTFGQPALRHFALAPSTATTSQKRPSKKRPSQKRASQTAAWKKRTSQRAPSKTRPSRKRPSKKRPSQKRVSKTTA